jgi:hypothetical protein
MNNQQPNQTTEDVLEQIRQLKEEKKKLESELKSREEMMNNLITYIRNTSI